MNTWQSVSYKIIAALGRVLIRSTEWLIFLIDKRHAFYDLHHFDWHKKVEAQFPAILNELQIALTDYQLIPELKNLSEEQQRIVKGNKWKSFFFYVYGRKLEKNCQQYPCTTAAVESIPGMVTAFFSILEPGTVLEPHRGTYAGVLRYHLALIVPENQSGCFLQIHNEIRHWQTGKSIIFDDTFIHHAENQTDELRVVLFVDFIRPLPFPLNLWNKCMIDLIGHSPYIQKIVERI
jgi:Aspartyl/asparaginyl beta-hydroxylase and related dioxygenases